MHGFFEKYCVECHNPGAEGDPQTPKNAMLDFRTQADPVTNASTIRCGIVPAGATQDPSCAGFPPAGQFPIYDAKHCNTKPSDVERWRVVAWIDAGTP
jgi:hypothetical protein